MKALIKNINRINKAMMWLVGGLTLLMGLALFYAVVMRYFFSRPQIWSYDLTGWLTGVVALLGGGYALLKNGHVRVDIFYEKFSIKTRHWVNILSSVLVFLIVTVLIWKGGQMVVHNYQLNSIASTGLNIHIWIKWVMVPLGGLLLGLQALVNLLGDIYALVTGREMKEEV